MWVLTYKGTDRIHLIGRGIFNSGPHDMNKLDYHEVPDQPIAHLYQGDPPELNATLGDLKLYSPEERIALIDRDTGKAIDEAIHPFAGLEEQIGILRDQLVHIINSLGLTPTADFERLNSIAIAKIEEGAKEKEGLNNAEDDED